MPRFRDVFLSCFRVLSTRLAALAAVLAVAALAPQGVYAQSGRFVGPHPVDLEGHWHSGEAHAHDGLGVGPGPFVEVGEVQIFLGDPVSFGYGGPVHTYRGAHPLPFGLEGYCALRGEHAHPFAPEGTYRREGDGVYAYAGALRGGRPMLRPTVMAPDEPILVAGAPPAAPFWFGGCLQQRGRLGVVGPLFGCRPRRRFRRTRAPASALHPRPAHVVRGAAFGVPPGRVPNPPARNQ